MHTKESTCNNQSFGFTKQFYFVMCFLMFFYDRVFVSGCGGVAQTETKPR